VGDAQFPGAAKSPLNVDEGASPSRKGQPTSASIGGRAIIGIYPQPGPKGVELVLEGMDDESM
jgi:hypothetical protein